MKFLQILILFMVPMVANANGSAGSYLLVYSFTLLLPILVVIALVAWIVSVRKARESIENLQIVPDTVNLTRAFQNKILFWVITVLVVIELLFFTQFEFRVLSFCSGLQNYFFCSHQDAFTFFIMIGGSIFFNAMFIYSIGYFLRRLSHKSTNYFDSVLLSYFLLFFFLLYIATHFLIFSLFPM